MNRIVTSLARSLILLLDEVLMDTATAVANAPLAAALWLNPADVAPTSVVDTLHLI
jgi:hypothetical protein